MVVVAALLACAPAGEAQTRREDATVVGERDGWTEIVLRDGKRALVPADDVADQAEPAPAPTAPRHEPATAVRAPRATAAATATPAPTVTPPAPLTELRTEVARLRTLLDEMETQRATPPPSAAPAPPPRSWLASESLTMLGLALVVGILIGAAVERQRARRSRSLRF